MTRFARVIPLLALFLAAAPLGACIETAVVVGAGAAGSTAFQERGGKGGASDLGLRAEIVHYWFQADQRFMSDLNLQIYEGRVLVSGELANEELRATAIQLTWKAKGVREVLNEVVIGAAAGLGTYWRDSLIVRELDARLLLAKDVSYLDYSIESFNGVVFLIGVAQDQAELDRVLAIARNIGGVKRVASHVLLKDDPRRFRPPPA